MSTINKSEDIIKINFSTDYDINSLISLNLNNMTEENKSKTNLITLPNFKNNDFNIRTGQEKRSLRFLLGFKTFESKYRIILKIRCRFRI